MQRPLKVFCISIKTGIFMWTNLHSSTSLMEQYGASPPHKKIVVVGGGGGGKGYKFYVSFFSVFRHFFFKSIFRFFFSRANTKVFERLNLMRKFLFRTILSKGLLFYLQTQKHSQCDQETFLSHN